MENNMQLDRQAIGKRIGQVRRREGLSQIEFARRLKLPVLLTEIAEHGVKGTNDALTGPINISINELLRLLKMISQIFRIPLDWLMYGEGAVAELDEYTQPPREELTLYLPVTISDQSLVEEMNRALLLLDVSPDCPVERVALQRECLESVVQKYSLYQQYADESQLAASAVCARKRMLEAVEKRCSSFS